MEDELFDFQGVEGNETEMGYVDVTLKQKIGEFDIGTKFPHATINLEKSWLSLYNDNGALVGRYQLKLVVVKDLFNEE